jgi:1,4-dihydroxy-2-naphthoate octaprenyltransferase
VNTIFFRFIIGISKPLELFLGILVYVLGVSIARYLGSSLNWGMIILGQVWVTLYQIGSHILDAYFHFPTKPGDSTRFNPADVVDEPSGGIRRDQVLWLSMAAFAVTASLTLVFIRSGDVRLVGLIVMGLMLIGSILTAVPPFSLSHSGYGEVIRSIVIASLIPALGMIFQHGNLHRILTLSTFPLIFIHLAMTIALQFPAYASNSREQKTVMTTFLGWELGLVLHNFLILGGFLAISLVMLLGLPSSIALPAFVVLPLGIFQVWYLSRIGAGIKPNWRVLNVTAILTFGLTVYLLLFRFLTR